MLFLIDKIIVEGQSPWNGTLKDVLEWSRNKWVVEKQ